MTKTIKDILSPHLAEIKAGHDLKIVEAVSQMVREIIGESEERPEYTTFVESYAERNKLRQRQRFAAHERGLKL